MNGCSICFDFTCNLGSLAFFVYAAAAVHGLFNGDCNFVPVKRHFLSVSLDYFQHMSTSTVYCMKMSTSPVYPTIYTISGPTFTRFMILYIVGRVNVSILYHVVDKYAPILIKIAEIP